MIFYISFLMILGKITTAETKATPGDWPAGVASSSWAHILNRWAGRVDR